MHARSGRAAATSPNFNHGATWLVAATALAGLLIMQAWRGAPEPAHQLANPKPAPCAPVERERLDRHGFEEDISDERSEAADTIKACASSELRQQ